MAKPTLQPRKITANPSRLVDSPPASERTRLAAPHKSEEGQSDMQMMHAIEFQEGSEISVAEALVPAEFTEYHAAMAWDLKMAEYLAIQQAAKDHDANVLNPVSDEMDRIWPDGACPGDARYNEYHAYRISSGYLAACEASGRLWAAEDKARRPLLAAPAPHSAALLWKLEHLFGPEQIEQEGGHITAWSEEFVRPFFDDVRRLAGAGLSTSAPGGDAQMVTLTTKDRSDWQIAERNLQGLEAAWSLDRYSDELANAAGQAAWDLCKMPAPNLDALEWKLKHWQDFSRDCVIEPEAFTDLLTDVQRLNATSACGDRPAAQSGFIHVYDRVRAAWLNVNDAPIGTPHEEEERLGDLYIAHREELVHARPSTDREFRLKFLALWAEGGAPNDDVIAKVIKDAELLDKF